MIDTVYLSETMCICLGKPLDHQRKQKSSLAETNCATKALLNESILSGEEQWMETQDKEMVALHIIFGMIVCSLIPAVAEDSSSNFTKFHPFFLQKAGSLYSLA